LSGDIGFWQKSEESIASDDHRLRYERKFPLWIRLFLLPWSLFCIPFIHFYVGNARLIDWADPPIFGGIVATFGFLILPLGFSGMILWFALFGDAVDLTLDARSGKVTLQRRSLFRNRSTRYSLAGLQIYKVELEADHPVYDAAIVTLRMPDGAKVRIGAFFRDEEAVALVDKIGKFIAAATAKSDTRSTALPG
jgi:hypothetical protein